MLEITDSTTLQDLYVRTLTLGARCTRCGHKSTLYPPTIAEYMHILGGDCTVMKFCDRLYCSKCKGTGVKLYTMTR